MTNATVSNDSRNAPEATADFFDEVKNGRDETTEVSGGYGSYPKIHVVEIGDAVFYGFSTGLPEDRGPWLAGYRADGGNPESPAVWFERDSVFNAETLDAIDPDSVVANAVNALIEYETGAAMTDGGTDESDDAVEPTLFD